MVEFLGGSIGDDGANATAARRISASKFKLQDGGARPYQAGQMQLAGGVVSNDEFICCAPRR
jgi:hypothetical protein